MAAAEEYAFEIGLRGVAADAGVNEHYSGYELFVHKALPWQWTWRSGWSASTRFDTGISYLGTDATSGGWLAMGCDIALQYQDSPLEFEAGWRPTLMFRDRFGKDDYGGHFQFSSHAGASFYWKEVIVTYRYLHISNAGIYKENPGLDVHQAGIGVRF